MLYSYNYDQLYKHICMLNHNDDTIKTSNSLLEKYTSHFIWKVCVWEGVGDRTELRHIDPHSYSHQRFFPVLLGCAIGGPGAQLSAGCWLSLQQLVTNWSGLLKTNWLPVFTELYNCSIAHSISPHNWSSEYALPPSLEWHVWPGRRSVYNRNT